MEFKLEKGQKYKLEDDDEGEFLGVVRKGCGKNHHNKLAFKLSENSYCFGEPDVKIIEDGTMCIVFTIWDIKNSLEELLKPRVIEPEKVEFI